MNFLLFYHSLLSDWNHGNAHFLRGVACELAARGHRVTVMEPRDAWSVQNLVAEYGLQPLDEARALFPQIRSVRYDAATLDLEKELAGADVIIVHEWNEPALVRRVGEQRRALGGGVLLFHDTHHRSLTDPDAMAALDLSLYDGVLAYGEVIRRRYLERGWARQAWTWHEAADTRLFHPVPATREGDLVWIGNWGDEERTAELHEFLIGPARELKLKTRVYGVRYPDEGRRALAGAGIDYLGWLPNHKVPEVFARHGVTVHIPRRPYVEALPGIPTIRPFEALACAIPLVCAPWDDAEGLFTPGKDFLVAPNGDAMRRHLRDLLHDPAMAGELAAHGRRTILARHTCAHRVDQLLEICTEVAPAFLPLNGAQTASPVAGLDDDAEEEPVYGVI